MITSPAYDYLSAALAEIANKLVGPEALLKTASYEEVSACVRALRGFEIVLTTQYFQGP
jgi:hypothetical protein